MTFRERAPITTSTPVRPSTIKRAPGGSGTGGTASCDGDVMVSEGGGAAGNRHVNLTLKIKIELTKVKADKSRVICDH